MKKNIMIWMWLLCLPFFLRATVNWHTTDSSPFQVTLNLSAETLSLNEQFSLEGSVQYPDNYTFDLTTLLDQLVWTANPLQPQFTVDQLTVAPLKTEGERQIQNFKATLSPLQPGLLEFSLKSFVFQRKGEDTPQKNKEIVTPVFHLDILPLPTGISQSSSLAPLAPLDPPFPLTLSLANQEQLFEQPSRWEAEKQYLQQQIQRHTFPWLSLLSLLILGSIGWMIYLNWERFYPAVKPVQGPSLQQQVQDKLTNLGVQYSIKKSIDPSYYAELASILRLALQEPLGEHAKGQTAEELQKGLVAFPHLKEKVSFVFKEMDQIEFAGLKPTWEQGKRTYQAVQDIIQEVFLDKK